MAMIPKLLKEMEHEATTTRKMLERIPNDKYDWQPHPKSMTIRRLASHIAELPGWPTMTLNTTGLDLAADRGKDPEINSTADVLAYFDKTLAEAKAALAGAREEQLDEMWTLSMGDKVLSHTSKEDVIRMSFSQMVHHRAQLGVYLRLLNVPIPGSYGPSADEQSH